MTEEARRILVLGLGNTCLKDDAVGIHVVRALAEEADASGFETAEAEVAGFALIDLLEGFDAAVVVDAVDVGAAPGTVTLVDVRQPGPSLHLVSGHQIDLPAALAIGVSLGSKVPHEVSVVGIQVQDARSFGETCTPAVEAAVPQAVELALSEARRLRGA